MLRQKLREQQESARAAVKYLPDALNIQKQKLLIALKQNPEGEEVTFTTEQEQMVADVMEYLHGRTGVQLHTFIRWDTSKATTSVRETLTKHSAFQLSTYLKCANNVRVAFADKENCAKYSTTTLQYLHVSIEYLLTHARQFGDPSKRIFPSLVQAAASAQQQEGDLAAQEAEPSSELAVDQRARELILDLKKAYDEDKFRRLNALVTVFTLIIVRRFIKLRQSRGVNNIVLTKKSNQYLIVHAYLTTEDVKTKKNLYDACIKYMEWHDMHLPSLFFKVLDQYNIGAGKLWDALIYAPNLIQPHVDLMIKLSLMKFSKVYYDISQLTDTELYLSWFPFSRFLSDSLHNLSDEYNVRICMVLESLLEMTHRRVNKSRNNYTEPILSDWAQNRATYVLKMISK